MSRRKVRPVMGQEPTRPEQLEPYVSQTAQDRVVLKGRLTDGSWCTVILIADPDGWQLIVGNRDEPVYLGKGEFRTGVKRLTELLGGTP